MIHKVTKLILSAYMQKYLRLFSLRFFLCRSSCKNLTSYLSLFPVEQLLSVFV